MSDLDEMLKEGPSLTFEPFTGDVQTAETVPAAVLPKETAAEAMQVELTPEMVEDTSRTNSWREKQIVAGLKSMLGITVKVKVVEPKSIVRSEGKAVRVIDKRNLYQ